MQPRTQVGLIVGAVGLILNICVAGFVGFCGPAVSLIAGAIAGFFAARQEKPATKSEGARAGAAAGGIAGGLIIIGQIIGAMASLTRMQASGIQLPFGQVPDPSGDPGLQAVFYGSGVLTGLCIGAFGALLAAGAGAGAAYLGTSEQAMIPPSQN